MAYEELTEENKNSSGKRFLQFTCESADYPVYKDYPLWGVAGRRLKRWIKAKKSFSGGVVQLQIVDPANDPLVDSSQVPLAVANMADTVDNFIKVPISYKPLVTKQLILRILCKNGSGTVIVDTKKGIDEYLGSRVEFETTR